MDLQKWHSETEDPDSRLSARAEGKQSLTVQAQLLIDTKTSQTTKMTSSKHSTDSLESPAKKSVCSNLWDETQDVRSSTRRSSRSGSRTNSTLEPRLVSCIKGTSNRIRVDCYGNDIVHLEPGIQKSSSNRVPQKITFRDQISPIDADHDNEKQVLAEVNMVESYKRYNADTRENDGGCCAIF